MFPGSSRNWFLLVCVCFLSWESFAACWRRVSFWTAKKKPKSRQGAVQMDASRPYSRSPGPPFTGAANAGTWRSTQRRGWTSIGFRSITAAAEGPGKPLGISPPGGERAFGVGGAQVRLSEAAHPETFRDFRRRVTLGRPRFLGFSHVLTPLQGRPLRSPVEIRIAVPKSTLIRRLRGHLPPRGRFRGAPGFTPGALARKLRRRPKTASKTNFAHSGPQWGRMETQASTPDFARRK